MNMRTLTSVVVIATLAATDGLAQSRHTEHTLKLDEGAASPPAKIENVAWLAGSWYGEAFGGKIEEVWSPPSAGTMVSTFKLMHDDQPTMYEIQVMEEENGTLALKLKHFNADLSGWEEKGEHVTFALVKITGETAYFDGLTYMREGADVIQVYLAVGTQEGVREESMLLRRAN